jgi:hypothetical protein
MNPNLVAQTVLSAVSQVGNLRVHARPPRESTWLAVQESGLSKSGYREYKIKMTNRTSAPTHFPVNQAQQAIKNYANIKQIHAWPTV